MKRLFPLMLIFLPLLLKAQTQISSMEEAFDLARRFNQDISVSKKLVESERITLKSILSGYLPQLKGVSNFDYNFALPVHLIPAEFLGGKEGEFKTVQFGTPYIFSAGLEASMPLVNTSLWTDTKIADLHAAAVRERVVVAEREVLESVAKGYYLNLLYFEALEISDKNLKAADTLLATAQVKFENLLIDRLDLNRFIHQQIRLKNELEQRQALYLNNYRLLKYQLGLKQTDTLLFTNPGLSETPEPLAALPEFSYPAIKERQLQMEAALWNYRKQQLKRVPELSLYGRYFKQAQRNEVDFFDGSQAWYSFGFAGLRMEIPLFSGGAISSRSKKAKLSYEIRKIEYEKQLEQEKVEDQQLKINLQVQKAAANRWKEAYLNAEESLQLAFLKYKEGIYGTDQYLSILQEALDSQSHYLSALTDLYVTTAIIRLKSE